MKQQWKRVNRLTRCPVCGKPDWCMISPDRSAAICPRVEEGAARFIEGSGWLHILRHTTEWMDEGYTPHRVEPLPEHNEVLAINCRRWISETTGDQINQLADKLGVSSESLNDLNVGWMESKKAWVFPMLRSGKRLLGVRVRPVDGKKFAVKGSKNALFIPNSLPEQGLVHICEGESDTAAMLTAGLAAVGRPSCNSGGRLLIELLEGRPVMVCIDGDGAGRAGGYRLAKQLSEHTPTALIMEPPPKYNDIREWLNGEGPESIQDNSKRLFEEMGRRPVGAGNTTPPSEEHGCGA